MAAFISAAKVGSARSSDSLVSYNTSVPVKRNYHFYLDSNQINKWHPGGQLIVNFYNSLSIFFPAGETMFVEAVRHHKHLLTSTTPAINPSPDKDTLRSAVSAFISQESVHGREHELYNEALASHYPSVHTMNSVVSWLTRSVTVRLSNKTALEATIALEHWTAILANSLLINSNEALDIYQCNPAYASLWKWHAMEETEHKAVAYDVYMNVYQHDSPVKIYLRRCFAQVLASSIFWTLVLCFFVCLSWCDGSVRSLSEWGAFYQYCWGRLGLLRQCVRPYIDYYRLHFHPWQHDNKHLLQEFPTLTAQIRNIMNQHQLANQVDNEREWK